jgi:hypothetical protein
MSKKNEYRFEPVEVSDGWKIEVYKDDQLVHTTGSAEAVGWCLARAQEWCKQQEKK